MIAIVLLAVALYAKKEDACFLILRYDAGVHGGVDVIGTALGESGSVIDIEEIARWLFGDDIHYACDGIGAIECATATTNDLDAVNHPRRQLFQAID